MEEFRLSLGDVAGLGDESTLIRPNPLDEDPSEDDWSNASTQIRPSPLDDPFILEEDDDAVLLPEPEEWDDPETRINAPQPRVAQPPVPAPASAAMARPAESVAPRISEPTPPPPGPPAHAPRAAGGSRAAAAPPGVLWGAHSGRGAPSASMSTACTACTAGKASTIAESVTVGAAGGPVRAVGRYQDETGKATCDESTRGCALVKRCVWGGA